MQPDECSKFSHHWAVSVVDLCKDSVDSGVSKLLRMSIFQWVMSSTNPDAYCWCSILLSGSVSFAPCDLWCICARR